MIKILKKYNFLVWLLLVVIFSDGSNLDDFVFPGASHIEVEGDLSFSNLNITQKNHKTNDLKSRPQKENILKKQKISDIDSPGLPVNWNKTDLTLFVNPLHDLLPFGFVTYKTALYLLHCSLLI